MIHKLAWIFGVAFICLGILGFLPVASSGGLLLGIFAVSTVNDIVYLLTGILAIVAIWSSPARVQLYFKVFGILYGIATIIGFLQGDTVLGFMTVTTANNLLHLIAAAIALWAGFGAKETSTQGATM